MSNVSGKYHDGKIILDTPVDWAEGIPVQVSPTTEKIGLTEDEWPTTPVAFDNYLKEHGHLNRSS
jgi:hypothetical protein